MNEYKSNYKIFGRAINTVYAVHGSHKILILDRNTVALQNITYICYGNIFNC